jgi:hypothetical protein
MSKYIKLETWQLESHQVGMTGKGTSGKIKFQGSAQDFSERIDLGNPHKQGKPKKPLVRKKKEPTLHQYLKNSGMCITYIHLPSKPWRSLSGRINYERIEIIPNFLWENQIKRDYPDAKGYYYSTEQDSEGDSVMSLTFTLSK